MLDRSWEAAIELVMRRHDCRHIFVEARRDRRIEVESGGATRRIESERSGASIELLGGERRFASELLPDQLERLVSAPISERSTTEPTPKEGATAEICAWVERLLAAAETALPGASFAVVWVDSEQEIVARALKTGRDRRRSARVRIDGYLERGGRQSRATAERVIRERSDRDLGELVAEVVERLEARLDTQKVRADSTEIIFAPGVGGVWIHGWSVTRPRRTRSRTARAGCRLESPSFPPD